VLSTFFGYIWLNFLAIPDPSITSYYTLGVWSIAVSCILEMCCEPAYLAGQAFLFIRLKVCGSKTLIYLFFSEEKSVIALKNGVNTDTSKK